MKRMKKANFMKLFLVRFLVVVLAAVVCCLGITGVSKYIYDNEKEWNIQNEGQAFVKDLQDKYIELRAEGEKNPETTDSFNNYLQWHIDASSLTLPDYMDGGESSAIAVCDSDTGELYAISGEHVYLSCHGINGLEGLFRYDGTDMDGFEKISKKMDEINKEEFGKDFPYVDVYYNITTDGVYVTDHNTFVPQNVRLVKYDSYTKEEKETILEYRMEPENPSDYTYVSLDSDKNKNDKMNVVLFGFGKNEARTKLGQFIDGSLNYGESLDSVLANESEDIFCIDHDGTLTTQALISRVSVGDKTWKMISFSTHDFFAEQRSELIKIYKIAALFAILITFIWTVYSYRMKKGYYELDAYRRRTTDTLAHDLKTPLMAISGYKENLENHTHPEKAEYYLQAIGTNVEYMNGLIEKVLELEKVEEGCSIHKEEFLVSALIRKVEEKYESRLGEKDLQIEINGEKQLVTDKMLFTQILDNLIGNAVKYSLPGTVIEVTLEADKLIITNQMEQDLHLSANQLTEPFVKGDDSRSGTTGSGLGLTIVAHIIRLLKYKMHINIRENEFIVEIDL